MRLNLILRLFLALTFAIIAAIFIQLIPIFGENWSVIRILLTILAALIGFLVFPGIASRTSLYTVKIFNIVIKRVSLEVLNQTSKLSKPVFPFTHHSPAQPGIKKFFILDTSAIIDGRILDIAKTGFFVIPLLIPKFVLTELQLVADSSDDLKRSRGRKGFETIEDLKKIREAKVEIWDKDVNGKNVDEKILNLAKELGSKIITTDFNLNKVASVSNLSVLNINDLSNALKTFAIPGEKFELKILQTGKDKDQGVGYLKDGTMVIVTSASKHIGKVVSIEVTKSLQSPTGRIIFAKLSQ